MTGLAFCSLSMGCGSGDHHHDHAHDTQASEPIPGMTHLVRSDSLELFIEFPAPVAGTSAAMAVHLSCLGDPMRPLTDAKVELFYDSLSGERVTAVPSGVGGLYLAEFPFRKPGITRLAIDVHHGITNERLFVDDVVVYATEEEARDKAVSGEKNANAVRYTKELVWKSSFAVERLSPRPFAEVMHTGGELAEAPGEERLVTALTAGVVAYATPGLVPGLSLRDGQTLFEIRATEVERGERSAAFSRAEEDLTVATAQYERAKALAADRILSEKELLEARLRYEQACVEYEQRQTALSFSRNKSTVQVPGGGYLLSLLVQEGAYVVAGQPLARIGTGRRIALRADVAAHHFDRLPGFLAANFRLPGSDQRLFATQELNGKREAYGRSLGRESAFIPVYFSMDRPEELLPGSAVEVFLLGPSRPALVLPRMALIEEQGHFFAFVQTGGEYYEKREVSTGATDGEFVEILAGLEEGDWVVTRGSYRLKLASVSGALPEHGHSH